MSTKPEDIYKPERTQGGGKPAVLILTTNDVEDLEFFYPYYRFIEENLSVDIVTPKGGAFAGKKGLGLKESKKITDVKAEDYQLLYIPGGKAPAELKENKDAIKLAKQFVENGAPVAAFCHGPQVLAAAGVLKGRRVAAWPEVQNELEEAGATYVNKETVVDGQFITARWPADLPVFMSHVFENIYAAKERPARAAG